MEAGPGDTSALHCTATAEHQAHVLCTSGYTCHTVRLFVRMPGALLASSTACLSKAPLCAGQTCPRPVQACCRFVQGPQPAPHCCLHCAASSAFATLLLCCAGSSASQVAEACSPAEQGTQPQMQQEWSPCLASPQHAATAKVRLRTLQPWAATLATPAADDQSPAGSPFTAAGGRSRARRRLQVLSDSSPESVAGSSPRHGPQAARVKEYTSAAEGRTFSLGQVEAAGLVSSSEGRRPRHGGGSEDAASAQEPPRLTEWTGALAGQAASGRAAEQPTSGSPETSCSSAPTPTLPSEVPQLKASLSGDTLPQPPLCPVSQQSAVTSFRGRQAVRGLPAWSPGAADTAGRGSLSRTTAGDASFVTDNAGGRQHAGGQLAANSSAQQLQANSPLPARHAAAASCAAGVTPAAHHLVLLSEGEEEASPVIWATARRLGSHSRSVCATSAQSNPFRHCFDSLHEQGAVSRLGCHSRCAALVVRLLAVLGSLTAC